MKCPFVKAAKDGYEGVSDALMTGSSVACFLSEALDKLDDNRRVEVEREAMFGMQYVLHALSEQLSDADATLQDLRAEEADKVRAERSRLEGVQRAVERSSNVRRMTATQEQQGEIQR